ncbi:MAG: hypothetical protein WBL23_07250 [Salinisphaera sp.]|uniref:hypothetical protein n=1 Tax=Salinisphaera sp. TaxID=1914330 RepID=UPI003C7D68DE
MNSTDLDIQHACAFALSRPAAERLAELAVHAGADRLLVGYARSEIEDGPVLETCVFEQAAEAQHRFAITAS